MILATDTHYGAETSRTAGVIFRDWRDAAPAHTHLYEATAAAAPYEPGAFYRRELPLILALLEKLPEPPSVIVIDGYVFLDAAGRKGIGAHLFDTLEGRTTVVGIAKRPFRGSGHAASVFRGASKTPLYVTAAVLPVPDAARAIESMDGAYRLPTLIRLCDRLSRGQ